MNKASQKEFFTALSMDTELLQLLRLDRAKLEAWMLGTDGCVSMEDWDEEQGFCIALKGTEGLLQFSQLMLKQLVPMKPIPAQVSAQ